MANYNSELTGEQIENALNAVNGLVSATNNGKILTVENGKLAAKSAIEIQGGTIDPLSITGNGVYTHSGFGGYSPITVNVPTGAVTTPLTVVNNGNYTPETGYDGFSSVSVNVPSASQQFTLFSEYNSNGLTPSGWTSTDGQHQLELYSGQWSVIDNQLYITDQVIFVPLQQFQCAIEITCTIDSDYYVATSSSYWYKNSSIFGFDIGGDQNDFALTLRNIGGSVYPGVGYKSSPESHGSITVLPGTEYTYKFFSLDNRAYLYVDGVYCSMSINNSIYSQYINKVQLFQTRNAPAPAYMVRGKIKKIKVWSYDISVPFV